MKRKLRQTTLTLVGTALAISPIMSTVSYAEESYYSTDNDLYDQQLKDAQTLVNKAKSTTGDENAKNAIDALISLPWSSGYKSEEKDRLLDEMFNWIDSLSNNQTKAKHMVYFVDTSINKLSKTLIQRDFELSYSLVANMPESKTKDKYMKVLKDTDKKMGLQLLEAIKKGEITIPDQGFDWSRLPEDSFKPYEDVDTGDYIVGYPLPPRPTPAPNPEALPEGNIQTNTKYQTVGGQCWKITTTTVNGKHYKTTQNRLTGDDVAYCSVSFGNNQNPTKPYNFGNVSPAMPGSGMNINSGNHAGSSYFGVGNYTGNQNKEENLDANLSTLTLQYTLDRTEAEPYYYETDMAVNKDGTVTYQQQRDVLFQLAIRSGGKAVEDKDRFMILIEDKIIVVENKGDKIPVTSFESILKGFKAQVKAMERKVGTE